MNSKLLIWSFFFLFLLSGSAVGADDTESADKPKADSPLIRKTYILQDRLRVLTRENNAGKVQYQATRTPISFI
jgi:hypothetical protein